MKILENKFFQFLIFVLMIVVIGYLTTAMSQMAKTTDTTNVISVSGTGEVYATPDVGLITISVLTHKTDVASATDENSKKMNDVISYLKNNNVNEKDIKTVGFNINPVYSWDKNGIRHTDGFDVSQSLEVKIRDLSKVGEIISNAASYGANEISSLSFIIDNDEQVKEQAKNLAIADARTKAKNLETALGVKLGKIVNFSEGTNYYPVATYGLGGAAMKTDSAMSVPTIQTGQNKITSTVTIIYSIK